MGAGALIALVGGGGGFIFLRTRRASHKCRVCGASVEASGDLCKSCRHEAAEAVRRAVAERAEHQRAQEEEQQRLRTRLSTKNAAAEQRPRRTRKLASAWNRNASRKRRASARPKNGASGTRKLANGVWPAPGRMKNSICTKCWTFPVTPA